MRKIGLLLILTMLAVPTLMGCSIDGMSESNDVAVASGEDVTTQEKRILDLSIEKNTEDVVTTESMETDDNEIEIINHLEEETENEKIENDKTESENTEENTGNEDDIE